MPKELGKVFPGLAAGVGVGIACVEVGVGIGVEDGEGVKVGVGVSRAAGEPGCVPSCKSAVNPQ